eukprot:403364199
MFISDGVSQIMVLINNKIYGMMEEQLENYCVIQIYSYIIQKVSGKTIVILTKPPRLVYKDLKQKIGQPRDLDLNIKEGYIVNINTVDLSIPQEIISKLFPQSPEKDDVSMSQTTEDCGSGQNSQHIAYGQHQSSNQNQKNNGITNQNDQYMPNNYGNNNNSEQQQFSIYTPIKALSTFNYDWRIKARVVKKHEKKLWKNSKGEGWIMNIELMDCFGTQIQATFFKDSAERFDQIIKEGNIYLFSNGSVKLANHKYTQIRNDFTLVFDKNADIVEVPDDLSIQEKGFNFLGIKDIMTVEKNKIIDIIGILHQIGPLQEVQTKAGHNKEKRMLTLADESEMIIQLCLWGDMAHRFDMMDETCSNHVIAIKGGKVVDYAGKQLNIHEDAYIMLDIPHPRTEQLRAWYDNLQNKDVLKNIVVKKERTENNQAQNKQQENVRMIAEVLDYLNQASQDQSKMGFNQNNNGNVFAYFWVNCQISFIKKDDKLYYLACPEENCRKKVIEDTDSKTFRCESCNQSFQSCVPTYMLMARIIDQSDSIFVNFYREQGSQIMSVPPEVIRRIKEEEQEEQLNDIFIDAQFKPYQILIKAKQSNYGQDSSRTSFFATKIQQFSYQTENKEILRRLELYNHIPDIEQYQQ